MYLDDLNPHQKEAAMQGEGPLMILAGAGAGKTKTLTYRIARLIETGTPANNILAVTFTNKAAGEMRDRVIHLLETLPETKFQLSPTADGRLPTVATFHSLGVRILRENSKEFGLPRSFVIWDRSDSIRAIKAALTARGIEKQYEPKHILGRISKSKGDAITRAAFSERIHSNWEQVVSDIWLEYEKALKEQSALDFDDLLLNTLLLLQTKPDIRERYQKRWTHIMIDEYQDTNAVQYEIMQLLVGSQKNICVVGDVDQNIYSWRGADISHLLTFEKTFPNTKVVLLEQNYRSTKTIIAAANDIISHNKNRFEKNLFTENSKGEKIIVYTAFGEGDEANFIASSIAEKINEGIPKEEIAILYRANFQSRVLEEALNTQGIPYRMLGTKFFDRAEVKDVLSYLRAALNPKSRIDIARIVGTPPRGIGKATLAHMLKNTLDELSPAARKKVETFQRLLERINEAANTQPVSSVLKMILTESGLETHLHSQGEDGLERLENIKELVSLGAKYDEFDTPEGAERLLEEASLASEQDSLEKEKSAVSLMTVHASKGLEFDLVYITGLEDGLFPHEKYDEESDEEEERRLFYVALTRARSELYLTHAATRMMYGNRDITSPSPFLEDIAAEYRIDIKAAEQEKEIPQQKRNWWDEEDEPTIE